MGDLGRWTTELLLNCLWQGAALALLAWCFLRLVPAAGAAVRYAVWYAALVALASLPLLVAGARLLPGREAIPAPVRILPASAVTWSAQAASEEVPANEPESPAPVRFPIEVRAGLWTTALAWSWMVIAAILMIRLGRSYRNLAQLKLDSVPLEDAEASLWAQWFRSCYTDRRFELRSSEAARMPLLAGLFQPVILFPASLVRRLNAEEKYRICLHELAHLRRWDDWTKLGQKLIESVLFFHPAVRWLGRKLDLEREIACDDWVVSVSGSARPYALCLSRLAELASAPPCPAVGSTGDRKQIFRRIEMVLDKKRNARTGFSKFTFIATLLLLCAASLWMVRMTPVFAVEAPSVDEESTMPVLAQAAPTPQPQAKPSPMPEPRPEERKPAGTPSPELEAKLRALTEEMRPLQEEIRKLTSEIEAEVERSIKPQTKEIEKLAQQISEQVQKSIEPEVKKIEEVARKIAEAHRAGNEELVRKLEKEMHSIEETQIRAAEERVREIEKQIRAREESIRQATESTVRALEKKVRAKAKEMEEKMRLKEGEIEKLEKEMRKQAVPPAPPAPPAPAAAFVPPAAPVIAAHPVAPVSGVPGGVRGGVPGGVKGGVAPLPPPAAPAIAAPPAATSAPPAPPASPKDL